MQDGIIFAGFLLAVNVRSLRVSLFIDSSKAQTAHRGLVEVEINISHEK